MIDQRQVLTTATRSLDVVLHLLPQAARDLREVFRYALTIHGITKEEEGEFALQEVLLSKLYDGFDAMRRDQWGLADKYFQEVISECEGARVRIIKDFQDEVIENLRSKLDGTYKGTPPKEDDQNGEEK
jgi:hypothetical protein